MNRKDFIHSFAFLALFMLPLGIWGDSYIDDISRATTGGYGWSTNARPVADAIFYVMNFGGLNPASYPLPLLIAMLAMSACACIIKDNLLKPYGIVALLICCTIFISPLYLGNTSFNYDVLPMSASVLFSSLILFKTKGIKFQLIKSLLVTILTLCTYQASLNVIISLATTYALIGFIEKRDKILVEYILNMAGVMIGVSIYLKVISPYFISGDYSEGKSKVIDFLSEGALDNVLDNINSLSNTLAAATTPVINLTILISIVIAVFSSYWISLKSKNPNKKLASSTVISSLLFFLISSSVGPFLLMQSYANTPRALIGVSSFLMCVFILAYKFIGEKRRLQYLFIPAILSSLVMSYTYAQSVKVQRLYERSVANSIISDVDSISESRESGYIIIGTVGSPSQVNVSVKKYPLISILLQPLISDNGMWSNGGMMNYGMIRKMSSSDKYLKAKSHLCDSKLIKSGNYYDLLLYNDIPVIDFTRKCT